MKSLQYRFKDMAEKHPYHSSFIHFCYSIKGQKFVIEIINKWFKKLVDKDDYDKNDRKDLMNHFMYLTNL